VFAIFYLMVVIASVGTLIILITQNIKYIIPLYAILWNLGIGLFVYFSKPKSRINVSYALIAVLSVLWSVAIFFYRGANLPSEALLWSRVAGALSAFLPVLFLYFFSIFPNEKYPPNLVLIVFWLLNSGIFATLSFSNLIVANVVAAKDGFAFIPGPAFSIFIVYFIVFMSYAFLKLMRKHHLSKGKNKLQIKYIFFGFLLGSIFPVITNLILPQLGYSQLAGIGPFFVVFTIAFISFAITKTGLMDISVVISRTVAEIMAILFHGAIYLGLVWLYRTYVSTSIDLPFLTGTVAYGILVGQTHQALRLFIQTTTDKAFLHGKYDYYKSLAEASSHVAEKLSLPDILNVIYQIFYDIVEIANPRIFLSEYFTESGKNPKRYIIFDKKTHQPQEKGQAIGFDDPIVTDLIAKRAVLHDAKRLDASLIVPCLLENRLIAIFVLGPKLSEDAYTDDDVRLLQTLANQAAIALDHTRSYEKIKNDLEAVEHHLERSQRLASIGTLTAGVTHEIRNPLTAIRAETERLITQPRDTEFLKNYQELVLRNITRVEGIVERMLGLARRKEKQNVPVNINDQIDAVIPLIPAHNVTITKELGQIPAIQGDPEQIQEVFINIIQNAIQAMPSGGQITVKTYAENTSPIIEIADNGPGIPPEIQEKIFDPFFSTRHAGTGLGLSIAYRIIREHGGDIKVTSQVGRGTTFKITF
ncbi:MAG: ATP-binding protein, partial [Candidatus Margulisbacteria bacterium]|nr:ATP-binding protein [Candidatus Margulisiibacteriota bacterium]